MTRIKTLTLAFALALALASCSSYRVYSVQSSPSKKLAGGMVYSLPRTQIQVAVTFERTDLSSAPYADYSYMLGLPSPDSLFHIASIEVGTTLVADPQRYYFVTPGRTPICIDNRGLLRSIGVMDNDCSMMNGASSTNTETMHSSLIAHPLSPSPEYNLYDRTDTFYLRTDQPGQPSLVSTKKNVRTTRMQAEACAERIQEIQEKKQELLFGQYEGNYNGDAIQFIFNRLSEEEQRLAALFAGTSKQETVVFSFAPRDEKALIDSQTVVLFHFSPDEGVVEEGGMEVLCEVRCDNSLRRASRFIKHRTKTVGSRDWRDRRTFKYRIPETATVRLYCEEFDFSKNVKISQFGTIANLPAGRCKALFDPQTGDLIFFRK